MAHRRGIGLQGEPRECHQNAAQVLRGFLRLQVVPFGCRIDGCNGQCAVVDCADWQRHFQGIQRCFHGVVCLYSIGYDKHSDLLP